jgi:alpha-mannosidase
MRISRVSSAEIFSGTASRPLQVVRVWLVNDGPAALTDPAAAVTAQVHGAGVSTAQPAVLSGFGPGSEQVAEVGVQVATGVTVGTARPVTAVAEWEHGRAEAAGTLTVAEPGWTMWMVSHFHYDPVWWGTQGQYTEAWQLLPRADGELPEQRTAFELVRLHLDHARSDPDYKFVLAELDYLKPHFDAHPEDRADLLEFIRQRRVEIVGGSYNEPNTNLTGAELTIRNAVYGLAFQREVLGADPATAWMLDAFGLDPAYPGLMAAAGLAESAWARGPFHQWGPNRSAGGNELMQFPSEFEWLSPGGTGLLTSYMPNHYSAGWITHHAKDLAGAERDAYRQFRELAPVAVTRNVLLPVGGDHVIPSRWATAIHRDWNARYIWPRFVTAVPSEYFAAVRADAAADGAWIMPQTRDMNPVYTGKDVSYIDTKQANRAAEVVVLDGERLATAAWLAGADYPLASLDKAWRLLVFSAHHDAITGTESDQVYLDLLAGWREAYERGDRARSEAMAFLAGLADTAALAAAADGRSAAAAASERAGSSPAGTGLAGTGAAAAAIPSRVIMVFNTLSWPRDGLARITLQYPEPGPAAVLLQDDSGAAVSYLAEGVTRHPDGSLAEVTLTFLAADVPPVGMRGYLAAAGPDRDALTAASWQPAEGTSIENEALLVASEPGRAPLRRITDKRLGTELLAGAGNELLLAAEYPTHPRWGEGPWLLCPTGESRSSAGVPATVRAERCPIGSRLVASHQLAGLQVTQETVLWDGAQRAEFRSHVDGSIGQDCMLRVRFAASVPGGLPVYQSALSVVGRPPGPALPDVAQHSYTLDNPAHEWFGLGSTARVALAGQGGRRSLRAVGVAEVISPAGPVTAAFAPRDRAAGCGHRDQVRALLVALGGQGVTATCSVPEGPRYGWLEADSNLPDLRIALGGPAQNAFTAEVLRQAGPAAAEALERQLAEAGAARVWVPAARSRAAAFTAGADLRGVRDLPVLVVAGHDLGAAIGQLADDVGDAVIEVPEAAPGQDGEAELAAYSVGLLNRGTPSSLVTPEGELHICLMRACSAWPSGVWINGDRRAMPDGSSFSWQHWSHTFEYALTAGPGDWRTAGFAQAGQDYAHPLLSCETTAHPGPLAARTSFASVQPASAALMTMKPRGNPLDATGQPDRAAGVTVRLRDLAGQGTAAEAQFRLFTPARQAIATDLLEHDGHPGAGGAGVGTAAQLPGGTAAELPGGTAAELPGGTVAELPGGTGAGCDNGAVTVRVPPCGAVTAVVFPDLDGEAAGAVAAGGDAGAGQAELPEPVQPVFTRYWLHGKGPAPAGNLPSAVHLSPTLLAVQPGQSGTVRLTVGAGTCPASGSVLLDVPAGLRADPAGPLGYQLAGREFAAWNITVSADDAAVCARHFLAARITDPAGQLLEDCVAVAVGEPGQAPRDLPLDDLLPLLDAERLAALAEADLVRASGDLTLPPGGSGEISVRLDNHAASELRGEAQLISPLGSWDAVPRGSQAFTAGPGRSATIRFGVCIPRTARPGEHWWALVKLMYFGRLQYSDPVAIRVVTR